MCNRYGAGRTATNLIAAIGLTITTPVVTAWVLGDLSEVPAGVPGDYFIRPPDLGALEPVIGAVCAAVAVIALAWLVHASRTRRFDPRWWWVIAPLVMAGALVGFAWRVMTAASIGANIGVGLVVFFGGPILLALLGVGGGLVGVPPEGRSPPGRPRPEPSPGWSRLTVPQPGSAGALGGRRRDGVLGE